LCGIASIDWGLLLKRWVIIIRRSWVNDFW
jgi:hypothetical protein